MSFATDFQGKHSLVGGGHADAEDACHGTLCTRCRGDVQQMAVYQCRTSRMLQGNRWARHNCRMSDFVVCIYTHTYTHMLLNAHRTLPDTKRRDRTRQLPTGQSCYVRGSTTRRDTTTQKSGLVVSDLTTLDTCAKARFLFCRVTSCRRSLYISRFSCVSICRVMFAEH